MTKQSTPSFHPAPWQLEAIRRGALKLIVVPVKPQPRKPSDNNPDWHNDVWHWGSLSHSSSNHQMTVTTNLKTGETSYVERYIPIEEWLPSHKKCPYRVGGEIVCKERYKIIAGNFIARTAVVRYESGDEVREFRDIDMTLWPIRLSTKFLPARTIPQWASRYSLHLKSVEVRRVNTITEDEAVDCGCEGWWQPMHPDMGSTDGRTPAEQFQERYIEQHGAASFDSDFAWFARVEVNGA